MKSILGAPCCLDNMRHWRGAGSYRAAAKLRPGNFCAIASLISAGVNRAVWLDQSPCSSAHAADGNGCAGKACAIVRLSFAMERR